MDTERRFPRFAKQREGKVFLRACWKECTTVDVSRNGICLRFGETKTPPLGSTIGLKIPSFKALKPIYIIGILKWAIKEEAQFVGGVELNDTLSEYEWVKLRNHFDFPLQ